MPRPKLFATRIVMALSADMLRRIALNLRDGETRLDLIREAIERELERRERGSRR
jgi:hypothetical protein